LCNESVIKTMANRRVLFWLLLLLGSFAWTSCVLIKFKSMTCSSSNKTISPDFSCFIKTAAGKTTMNMIFNVTKPVYNFKIRYDVTRGATDESEARTIINVTMRMCSFLNGTIRDPASKWIITKLKKSFKPGFLHSCPYFGQINMADLSIETKGTSLLFSTGFYSSNLLLFNKDDSNIILAKVSADVMKD